MADENRNIVNVIPTPPVPELDSTPITIKPKDTPLGRRGSLGGNTSDEELGEDALKKRKEKLADPAVLVNIPTTPSAQAYEVAEKKVVDAVQDDKEIPSDTAEVPANNTTADPTHGGTDTAN